MFDGLEWVGKTTQLGLAAGALKEQGYEVWTSRVNGGAPIGEALRAVLFDSFERPPETDLYVHLAQQYALNVEVERKRQAGMVLLIDRSPLSIIAYQVYGSGLDEATGFKVANKVLGLLRPNLVISYMAPKEVIAVRHAKANHDSDYFEQKPQVYFDRVAKGYEIANKRFDVQVIDASGDIDSVHKDTMSRINSVLK